jgi:hypothetical protein
MTTTTPLFEREMRAQIAAAQAAVTAAAASSDPLLVDAAQDHLDDLIALALRNGLDITVIELP